MDHRNMICLAIVTKNIRLYKDATEYCFPSRSSWPSCMLTHAVYNQVNDSSGIKAWDERRLEDLISTHISVFRGVRV